MNQPPKERNRGIIPSEPFCYVFVAIRGIQAGREYYVAMCPLSLIPRIFLFDEEEVPPQVRAQRTLNKARIPEIAKYLAMNPKDYTLSSLTASISGNVKFSPIGDTGPGSKIGYLVVPMTAKFLINDGQHRRAAIEEALKINPDIGEEHISVVFYVDEDLKRSQQMFADLNKHAVRPSMSLSILYSHRDPFALFVKSLVDKVPIFKDTTEFEKTTISNRSRKLFTLSSIYQATAALLGGRHPDSFEDGGQVAMDYWDELTSHMPEWQMLLDHQVSSAELRVNYIHAHGVALHALGIAGHCLLEEHPGSWREKLTLLDGLDWSRSNTDFWEGRAMVRRRISKAHINLLLTTAGIKSILGLNLSQQEQEAENSLKDERRGR